MRRLLCVAAVHLGSRRFGLLVRNRCGYATERARGHGMPGRFEQTLMRRKMYPLLQLVMVRQRFPFISGE